MVALGLGTILIPFGGFGYATGFGLLTIAVDCGGRVDDCGVTGTVRP